jgi:phosphoribosyl 1,2-cyclic phosphodiesterase
MPRFASLSSGSRGNALLIEYRNTLLMVDCGLPCRTIAERLGAVGRDPRDVTALLVTHEHGDHVRGAASFARRYGTPLWATPGTVAASRIGGVKKLGTLNCHRELMLGEIGIEPYPVPHDAREPCQFVFVCGGRRIGVLSDTGHVTAHMLERLAGCDALALEANHDLEALWRGPYPQSVKARVASGFGHLDNGASAELLARVAHADLQWVVALHLSERNNSPERVRAALQPVLGESTQRLHLASQDVASEWIEVD